MTDTQLEHSGDWRTPLTTFALLLIVGAAAYLRFVGLNWDEFQHLHPDERFLTMVETGIRPVEGGWSEYFDTGNSTLNPHNQGFNFFVYGTAPIFLVRYLAQWIADSGLQLSDLGFESSLELGTGYDQVHLVGRAVSAFADVLSVFLLYFIGKRLYNRRVGLLAAALAAGSVALIQQAHFFTVDSVANLFVTLGLLCAARALHSDSPLNYALFGLALGGAAASRINAAPLALLILLAAWARIMSRESWLTSYAWRVALATVLSLLVFRIAQPYAFAGPSLLDISLNEHWLNNIREIRGQMGGDVDFPPNHQWTDRPALIFPWQNMVRWGMGAALGLAAWAGFGWAGWQLLRRWAGSQRHLLPVAWSGLYFLWQGMQWVKPVRYFLPIYPTLILLGAWALYELPKGKRGKHVLRLASPGLIVLVLGSTMLYAFAFSRIYTRPVTRVAASRWIYDNLPGPFSLVVETADGAVTQPVRMPPDFQYENSQPHTQSFTAQASGVISALRIGHLGDVNADAAPETFTVSVQDSVADDAASSATLTADLSANSGYTLQLQPPLSVTKGQNYQLVSQAVAGAPLMISGAQLVNESSWDDGLPLRMDGYDAFGGIYGGHNLELYWEDDEAKRERMLDILEQGDYILISSNRQYASIPRLPTRYPLTIAYYHALFSGELGFELAAEFESAPSLGSWQFSEQAAEEPFTVYDHPKVLIFRKTAEFSLERARQILGAVDLSQVIWMNPYKATAAPSGLMLPAERLAEQRAGGTWSQMFDSSSAHNRLQWLGALAWYGGLLILGWLLFPLAFLAFGGLPDRGYAVSKILSLLLVGWVAWMLGSLRWMPFTRATLGLLVGGLGLLAAGVAAWRADELRRWIVAHRRYIISVELLWLALFLFDLFIRWHNPDLWHPAYGGEKPMDFSYFNAVLRSTSFPPFDPWLAGGYINYYYFGYVLAAVPTKLLGIAPAFAYNLLLPMLFAMTGTGAFCVAYNLSAGGRQRESGPRARRLPLWGGLAAAALMVLLGNLGQLDTIAKGLRKAADAAPAPDQLLPGMGDVSDWATGLYRVGFEGQTIPMGTGEWYWNATRLIPHPESEAVPITEFPLFTFLYADLHAHMLALPLTLLVLTWALAAVLGARRSGDKPTAVVHWWVGALAIGALGPTNTWDLPTYLALSCVAVVYAQFRRHERLDYDMFLAAAGRVALLVALSALLFRPYALWYGSGYNAVELWRGSTTPLSAYLKIHGLFLFIIAGFLVSETRRWVQSTTIHGLGGMKDLLAVGIVTGVVVLGSTALLLFVGVQIAPLALGLLAWATLLLLPSQQTPQKRAALALLSLALLLTLLVELVRLEGDISRMNTVFKFYLQAWTLFSVTAGAGLVWVWQQLPDWQPCNARLWRAGLGLLVLIAAAYTLLAGSAKMHDRMAADAPHTLDGMAFMQFAEYHDQGQPIPLSPDYDAIRWLQENASGSPVIVEAHASEYKYGSRYTIYTGLPGVVGWNWHQRQQRAVTPPDLINDRVEAVNRFYRETDNNAALAFLRRYDVRYIVVSGYERAYYPGEGLEKFGRMANAGLLDIAYDHGDVVIYAHNAEPVE